ncbi:chlorophyll a/b-binding protein [Prochlorococcus sp. MIT 1341]|uniref:chlorophyll a/b-binding protein n=1 Tax=Prochlorococcus sp. MIT 1341 TaxID=3096221 RepID=UPI002A74EF29|nr:chlorophyll a/b-binding protein [Prochlorococcus sp. MIT 1341]
MNSSPYITTEEGGRQNMFAIESRPYQDPNYSGYAKEAEIANSRWAMIGFVAALGAYATTGQILPGIF